MARDIESVFIALCNKLRDMYTLATCCILTPQTPAGQVTRATRLAAVPCYISQALDSQGHTQPSPKHHHQETNTKSLSKLQPFPTPTPVPPLTQPGPSQTKNTPPLHSSSASRFSSASVNDLRRAPIIAGSSVLSPSKLPPPGPP